MARKILIVEDEPDISKFLRRLLEDNGYEIFTASDGREALEVLRDKRPDLVTLDLMMPNETGTRFYRKMVQQKEFKDLPVIVVSGLAGRNLAVTRPFAVLDKPIDKERLLEEVQKAIG
ncbi:response regulator [Planctomycetota bacterium]